MSDFKNPHHPNLTLSDADAAVLDAIIEARARGVDTASGAGPLPPGGAARAARVHALLNLLSLDEPDAENQPTDGELDVLTADVLEAIATQRQRQRFAEQVQVFAEPRRTIGVSLRQLMTAAAVFLIGLSLLLPVLNNTRHQAQQTACAAGLGGVGGSFARYASDHQGNMPRYDIRPASAWWRVGQATSPAAVQSNSANLYLLVRLGYTEADALNCPANPSAPAAGSMTGQQLDYANHQQVSYSYQNQFRAQPIKLADGRTVIAVLADKNPLFVIQPGRFAQHVDTATTAPSVVHGSRGQNVLLSTGQVRWVVRPEIERTDNQTSDNIWTAQNISTYTGTETPADAGDSFLVP